MNSFRTLSKIEGVSLVALLFFAVPLALFLGVSGPLFYIGLAYGMLLACYLASATAVGHREGWSLSNSAFVVGLGVVPLGFLLLNKKLKQVSHTVRIRSF